MWLGLFMTSRRRANGELRLLIADDHRLFGEALMSVFSEDERIEVVGLATNGQEAIEMVDGLEPDVVLMDVRMPIVDGLEATRRLREKGSPTQILIMTGSQEFIDGVAAREAGASGFLSKEQSLDELRQVFFEVASLATMLGRASRL